jgi:enolase
VANVNTSIADGAQGFRCQDQRGLDEKLIALDGTRTRASSVPTPCWVCRWPMRMPWRPHGSCRLWKHLAGDRAARLPVPMMNIINGGAHADNNVDMQEFMILPVGLPSFSEALRAGTEVFHALKSVLKGRGLNTAVGDEGGFAPDLRSNEEAIETILEAVNKAGYRIGKDIWLGLDVASSEFYKDGKYHLEGEGKVLSAEQLIEFYAAGVRNIRSSPSRMAWPRAIGMAGRS